jgi:serine/threonine-protein kinase
MDAGHSALPDPFAELRAMVDRHDESAEHSEPLPEAPEPLPVSLLAVPDVESREHRPEPDHAPDPPPPAPGSEHAPPSPEPARWTLEPAPPVPEPPAAVRPVARQVDDAQLGRLALLLTSHLGPVAKVIVRRRAEEIDDPERLLRSLAQDIPRESERPDFMMHARDILKSRA